MAPIPSERGRSTDQTIVRTSAIVCDALQVCSTMCPLDCFEDSPCTDASDMLGKVGFLPNGMRQSICPLPSSVENRIEGKLYGCDEGLKPMKLAFWYPPRPPSPSDLARSQRRCRLAVGSRNEQIDSTKKVVGVLKE